MPTSPEPLENILDNPPSIMEKPHPDLTKDRRIGARLRPLYIAAFLQGLIFWYAIEKLFMSSIGFTDTTIGLMVTLYSAIMLLIETPSGIVADRWSRKGMLIAASVVIMASSFIAGISHSVPVFIVSSLLWGVYFALYSGAYDSIVYDTLMEESGHAKRFDFYLGRVRMYDSIALVAGSLIGGTLASAANLRLPFFMSIIPSALAIVALWKFREPVLHKSKPHTSTSKQVRDTFRAVLRSKAALPIVAINVLLAVILQFYYEFDQLWLIALSAPTILYGITNAFLLSGGAVGGLFVGRFNLRQARFMVPLLASLVAGAVILTMTRDTMLTVIALTVVCIVVSTVTILYTSLLHEQLSSNIRAGASSAVSSLTRAVVVPGALLFGWIGDRTDIFTANTINIALIAVACLMIALGLRGQQKRHTKTPV